MVAFAPAKILSSCPWVLITAWRNGSKATAPTVTRAPNVAQCLNSRLVVAYPVLKNVSHLARSHMSRRVPPHGPRLASSNLSHATRLSGLRRSQFHFCCPTHALSANAGVVRASVPSAATIVLSVTASLQADIGLSFSRCKRAMIEIIAPVLMMTAMTSRVQELGESRNEINLSTELRFVVSRSR
jgi:hypothetical protein